MVAVNPEILIWARENAALSIDEAARKLNMRDSKARAANEKLQLLERGEVEPTQAQLHKMSKAYFQPLLVFYLEKPPIDIDWGADFRTTRQRTSDHKGNARLKLLMRNVKVAQGLIRDAMEEDDVEALPFVSSATTSMSVKALAQDISQTLTFEIETFRRAKTFSKAFAYLRDRLEANRIFVLLLSDLGSHHTTIPVDVFRGFAFADELAPFIVINRKDAISAWSFTALHEVAHLWLGSSGVSGQWGATHMESFCNQVAAELLFPSQERQAIAKDVIHETDDATKVIGSIAEEKRLSRAMVAYSLFLSGKFDEETWRRLNLNFEMDSMAEAKGNAESKSSSGGPSYYVVRRHHLGNALLEVTKQFVDTGQLQPTKAALVLGVKPLNVHPLLYPELAAERS